MYNKQAREIFLLMLDGDVDLNTYINQKEPSINEEELFEVVIKVLDQNPNSISDYKNGKDKAIRYLVGQVIKEVGKNANPALINELVLKELKVR